MGAKANKMSGTNTSHAHRTRVQSVSISSVDDLKESDYKFIMEQTGMSRGDIKSVYNKFIRESVNGELDHDGFVEFYNSLMTDRPLDKNSQFIFDAFDKDHNGKVSFREFLNAFVLITPGNMDKKLEYTFELYDMDGNGYLDLDEIYRIVVRIFELLDQKKSAQEALRFAEETFKRLDVSPRDGKITKEEYVNGMKNNPELQLLLTPF